MRCILKWQTKPPLIFSSITPASEYTASSITTISRLRSAPAKNVVVFYCGQGCNNHYINSGECTNLGQLGKENNIKTAESLKAWGSFCAETGAEMWYWYYGVTYHYYMVSMPSVYNIYYDYKFMYEECNVRGIYYEGGGPNYNYETLKSYLSTRDGVGARHEL